MSDSEDLALLTSLAGMVGQPSPSVISKGKKKKKKTVDSSSKWSRADSAEESADDVPPLKHKRTRRTDLSVSVACAVDAVTGEALGPLLGSAALIVLEVSDPRVVGDFAENPQPEGVQIVELPADQGVETNELGPSSPRRVRLLLTPRLSQTFP